MFDLAWVKEATGLPQAQIEVLARTFLTEVQESGKKLKSCFDARNWPELRRLAHQLKPAYYLMGVIEVLPFFDYLLHLDQLRPNEAELEQGLQSFLVQSSQLEMEIKTCLHTGAVFV